jgi:hypothetical protein
VARVRLKNENRENHFWEIVLIILGTEVQMGKFKRTPPRKNVPLLREKFRGLHRMKYSSPTEFDDAVRAYFDKRDAEERSYTVAGLIEHLGFCSRQTLEDYRGREEFHEIVERAFLHIEDQRNEQLVKGQGVVAGQIFDLKANHKWRDKDEVKDQSDGTKVIIMPIMPGSLDMAAWQTAWRNMLDAKHSAPESLPSAPQAPDIIDITPRDAMVGVTEEAQ